jgi:hypothetical protein
MFCQPTRHVSETAPLCFSASYYFTASRKSKFIADIFRIITEKQFSGSLLLYREGKKNRIMEVEMESQGKV